MSRNFASLEQFAGFCSALAISAKPKMAAGLYATGNEIYARAYALFGKEEELPPPLKEATQEDRIRHGFSPDQTLLRTGSLRDSLSVQQDGLDVVIGSDDPRMVWQELGTPRGIPPRPLLRIAANQASMRAQLTFRNFVSAMLGVNLPGGGVAYTPTGENIVVPSGPFGGALLASQHIPGGLYGPGLVSRSSSHLVPYRASTFIRVP